MLSNPAVVGAITALVGTLVGASTTLSVELVKARTGARAARRDALLVACSNFTAAVARARSLCSELNERADAKEQVRLRLEDARVEVERLRLLIESKVTQESARMALRHLWAVWHLAERGTDPRADQFLGVPPGIRLRNSLTELYIGVRRETGSKHPDDVFADPIN